MSWLGHTQSALPRIEKLRDQPDRLSPPPVAMVAELPPEDISMAAEPEHVASDDAPSAPAMDTPILEDDRELTLDAIAQRYPLLRNAL